MSLLKAAAEFAAARGDGPEAVKVLQALSLPLARSEGWRYFPLRQVLSRRYVLGAEPEVSGSSGINLGAVIDVRAQQLPDALRLSAAELAHSEPGAEGFSGLIQQLAGPLRVMEVLHSPVLPVRLQRDVASTAFNAQRWLIKVASGAQVLLLDELQAGADSWHGDELQLDIGAGASVVLLRCVSDATTAVRQSRSVIKLSAGASLQWFGIDIRCGIARHELVVRLQGEQASASVRGGGLLSGKSYSETRLELDHEQPGADTSTLWKLVGTESSRGVFNGRIAIAVGADRSDAQLRTASLLLSEQAEIDVKPELEIYADEVSASHGATVGQLDERALFYLRSRGIGLDDARRMLTEAFLRDLFDAVPEGPARVLIEQALAQALPKLDEIAA